MASARHSPIPSQPGIRQEVFALDEGDVVITFPEELSAESYSDLAAYLDLFKRKMKRRSGAPTGHPSETG